MPRLQFSLTTLLLVTALPVTHARLLEALWSA